MLSGEQHEAMEPPQNEVAEEQQAGVLEPEYLTLSEDAKREVIQNFERDFRDSKDWLSNQHAEYEKDKEFAYDPFKQWDPMERNRREGDPSNPRPCLSFDKVLRLLKRIVNDAKQADLGAKTVPVDDTADPLIADIYRGLIRKLEANSSAQSVYDQGFEDACAGGIGFWRIYPDWESEDSFDQTIVIKRVTNPKAILFSPASVEPTLADSRYFIVYEQLDKEQAKAEHPDIDWENVRFSNESSRTIWTSEHSYTIAEYFETLWEEATLCRVNGRGIWQDELNDEQKAAWKAMTPSVRKQNSRKGLKKKIRWHRLAGGEVIESREWPGKIMPIIFCPGREYWMNGKRRWFSVTSYLRDPQTLYNYFRSTQMERHAMGTRAPWLLPVEAIAGMEDIWKTAHLRNRMYLPYNSKDEEGKPIDRPQLIPPIIADPSLDAEVDRLDQEMLDISGINLATLGDESGEKSGRAILARQRQGELINADFIDGLSMAIKQSARVLVDLIPKTIPWDKAIRMLGPEYQPTIDKLIQKGLLNWDNGRYDVEVEVGSVSTTKREEAKEFWQDALQKAPQLAPVVLDVLAKKFDEGKDSELIAKRLKAMLPPQVQNITADDDGGQQQTDALVQQAVMQERQQAQQAMQQMQAEIQDLQTKLQGHIVDNQTKLQIAEMEQATQIKIAEIKAGTPEQLEIIAQEILRMQAQLSQLQAGPPPAQTPPPPESGTAPAPHPSYDLGMSMPEMSDQPMDAPTGADPGSPDVGAADNGQ